MTRSFSILTILLLTVINFTAAGNYNDQWQKGTSFYSQKQYDSAAFYFEQIAAGKPLNAEVYYNLGNAYYRLNKIPLSVLNYERALRINPDHKEAKDNLILAQNRISNHIPNAGDIFFITWWQSLTQAGQVNSMGCSGISSVPPHYCFIAAAPFSKGQRQAPACATAGHIYLCVHLPAIAGLCFCKKHGAAYRRSSDAGRRPADE